MKVSPIVTKNKRLTSFGMAFALAQSLCSGFSLGAMAQDPYTPGHTSTGSSATAAGSQAPASTPGAPLVRPVTAPASNNTNSSSSSSSSTPQLRPPLPTLDSSLPPQDAVVDNGNLTAPIKMPTTNTPTSSTTGLPSGALSLPLDASGLTAKERQGDYDVVNTQADEFRKRFLQGEAIELDRKSVV